MTVRRIHPGDAASHVEVLRAGFDALATELELPTAFAASVLVEIAGADMGGEPRAAARLVGGDAREDARELPLITLDPLGSRDLDQAFAIEPAAGSGAGAVLHYAIADVAAHVVPGGAVEAESLRRGETVYLPGRRVPLHPPQLSEGVASLLPGEDRLAVLWTLTFDGAGELAGAPRVRRAVVRSTAQLDYVTAQADFDAGRPHAQIAALASLGPLLQAAAVRRGAIELPAPEQELVDAPGGGWALSWVPRRPLEDWNAQLSLATGRAAAGLMLGARQGLLRTLPPAPVEAQAAMRTAAAALGIVWPVERTLSELLGTLDGTSATELAFVDECRTLLRGAGYLVLDGTEPEPDAALHAAVAAPYAHVTAPLRRLGDRFATEAALAAASGVPVPAWAARVLPELPALLTAAGRRSGAAARGVVDLAEAVVLAPRIGEHFDAAVIEARPDGGGEIQLDDPPVRARITGDGLVAGHRATAVLTEADPAKRRVRFAVAAGRE